MAIHCAIASHMLRRLILMGMPCNRPWLDSRTLSTEHMHVWTNKEDFSRVPDSLYQTHATGSNRWFVLTVSGYRVGAEGTPKDLEILGLAWVLCTYSGHVPIQATTFGWQLPMESPRFLTNPQSLRYAARQGSCGLSGGPIGRAPAQPRLPRPRRSREAHAQSCEEAPAPHRQGQGQLASRRGREAQKVRLELAISHESAVSLIPSFCQSVTRAKGWNCFRQSGGGGVLFMLSTLKQRLLHPCGLPCCNCEDI